MKEDKNFRFGDGGYIFPSCLFCKHFFRIKGVKKCMAFPDGIPEEILAMKHDHKTPYPGDKGIMFEMHEGYVDYIDHDYDPDLPDIDGLKGIMIKNE